MFNKIGFVIILFKLIKILQYSSSAFDDVLETNVVIKKLARPFSTDKAAKRVYREIQLLKHINHYNVISLYNVFANTNKLDNFNDV